MISILWFLNKRINVKLVIFYALTLVLIVAPIALANYVPGDQKPVPPDRRSDGGTTRGCSDGDIPLTVLASRNYVGRTISQRPTFAWFVPQDSAAKPMQFIIYEWTPRNQAIEVHKVSLQSLPGIMKLSPFSKDEMGLQTGKEYRWQVVIHCDPDNPSGDLVSAASIEVMEMPATVKQQLNRVISNSEKAQIYAKAGLWYDALDEALKLSQDLKLGEVGFTLLNNLAYNETKKISPQLPSQEREEINKWINNLKQIAYKTR